MSLVIDLDYWISEIDPRLWGGFVEHIGRAVYTGIYQPDHPTADRNGFRGDVIEALRPLGIPVVRYPGGSFVSTYRWEDGVGPLANRPRRTDLAWKSVETNEVGIAEFAKWADEIGADIMMAINLGTRGIDSALDLLEYSNKSSGTFLSDLRRRHGNEAPFAIRTWSLGNELDAEYQIGGKTAEEYGRLAAQTSRAMKILDPDIETVLAGTSTNNSTRYPEWNRIVLEAAYDDVDYLSIHKYLGKRGGSSEAFLAQRHEFDDYLRSAAAIIRHVKAMKRSSHDVYLCVDEWNVWSAGEAMEEFPTGFPQAPALLEDIYTFEDALVLACMANALIRNSDVVKIACIAQLVNAIAPLRTVPNGGVWKQTTFAVFEAFAIHGRGRAIQIANTGIDSLDCSATLSDDREILTLFVVNTDLQNEAVIDIRIGGCHVSEIMEHQSIAGHSLDEVNSVQQEGVTLRKEHTLRISDEGVAGRTAPASFNIIRLKISAARALARGSKI